MYQWGKDAGSPNAKVGVLFSGIDSGLEWQKNYRLKKDSGQTQRGKRHMVEQRKFLQQRY